MLKKTTLFVTGILTSILILEGAVRIASPILGPPLVSWNTMEDAKKLKLDEFKVKYGNPKFMFMGNSTTLIGVNPTIFQEQAGLLAGSTFNAAMNGSDIKTMRDFLLSYILKEMKPENLVLLFSNSNMIQYPNYETFQNKQNFLLETSYLYKYRNTLKDPMTVNTIVRTFKFRDTRQGIVFRWADNLDDFGYSKYSVTDASIPQLGWNPALRNAKGEKKFDVELKNLKYLIEIRSFARKMGVNLIIGTVPLLARNDELRGQIEAIADALNIEFVQGNDAVWGGKYFQDGVHLNKAGSEVFSKFLGRKFSQIQSKS